MRRLTFFLAAVLLVLVAREAPCRELTFSIDPNDRNSLRYSDMRVEEADPLSITTGRFLSVDPHLDVKKNLPEPQRWNRYAFVTNNPLKYTDPDGRERRIMVLSMHSPEKMNLAAIQQSTVAFSEGWSYDTYDSGYDIDVRHSLGGPSMLHALRGVDNSGTDIVVMNTHGGRLFTDTGGGPSGNRGFEITASAIADNLGKDKPQAIILAGCGTMDSAQQIANKTGTIVFGITSGQEAYSSLITRAGTVLANVYAATGSANFALAVANRMLGRTIGTSGQIFYPQFAVVEPEQK